MTRREPDGLTIRAATAEDRGAVIELCRLSLGWKDGDPNEDFFAWKHDENPFGESPAWVAVAEDGTLAGLRVFLRWRFRTPGGERIEAVRAVDTATHPDWQGKGIFTRLTLGALDEMAEQGVGVVFNTPNDQSRPGYLKMGWSQVGRVPVGVRVRSARSAVRVAGARAAAEKWSSGGQVGIAATALGADAEIEQLLESLAPEDGIATDRSIDYLRWRYSFAPLGYRALPLGDHLRDGVVVFRVRRRGPATELTLCEVLAPAGAPVRRAIGYLLRRSGADYAIRTVGGGRVDRESIAAGFVPLTRLGPILTWRPVTRSSVPAIGDLAFTLGDVELF
ncbi:MAG: GNAT family N-acetyltransferase [Actinomycetota bacterium]|nr:GNAT family N-acetyltransferase [Actinomycetota bacterium]